MASFRRCGLWLLSVALREGGNLLGSLEIDQLYSVLQDAVLCHFYRFSYHH